MKTVLTFLFVLSGLLAISQTNVISSKDHGMDLNNVLNEPDNFGGPAVMPVRRKMVKVVEYLGEGCIAEHYYIAEFNPFDYPPIEEFKIDTTILPKTSKDDPQYYPPLTVDTICEYGVFSRELSPRIKSIYGLEVEYRGFKEPAKTNHFFDGMKRTTKSEITWVFGIVAALLFFFNFKKFHLLSILIIAGSTASFAQTNVISSKDHSLSSSSIIMEPDNFGEPPNRRFVDTIEYIGYNRFVVHHKIAYWHDEIYSSWYTDTVVDENNNGELTEHYYRIYGDIIYINFMRPQPIDSLRRGMNHYGFPWYIGTAGVFIVFLSFFRSSKTLTKK